jgi:hypothetical protein
MKRHLLLWTVALLLPVLPVLTGCANLGRNQQEPATSADDLDINIETPSAPGSSRQRGAPASYSFSPTGQDIERSVGIGSR